MEVIRFLNLQYFYQQAYELFTGDLGFFDFSLEFLKLLLPFIILFILLLITFTIYSMVRLKQIRDEEKEKYATADIEVGNEVRNKRWENILNLLNSDIPSNWRQAVLDADIMLDDLLSAQGYRGETMGEKMKGVEKSDFTTIEYAWEAHKARNRIAHEGSDYLLTQREARRLINLFSLVFKEFDFI